MSIVQEQASVHRFDPETLTGEVITNNGRVLAFSTEAFMRSSLRTLRVGQRLNVDMGPDGIRRLWIDGIGAGQTIR